MPLSDDVKVLFESTDEKVKAVLTAIAPKVEEAFDKSEAEFAKNKSRVNAEAQALRKHKIALERLARENGVDKVDDPEEFVNEFSIKLKGTKEKETSVEQQLKLIQKKLEDAEKKTQQAESEKRVASVKAKAQAEFSKFLYAPSLHLNQAIDGGLTIADDGESLIWKDGEDILDFSEGLKRYVSKHKDDAKNTQQPGASSTKGKRGSSSRDTNTITQAEYDAMQPIERARFAKANPGWSISG
jgi:hypothetical protein